MTPAARSDASRSATKRQPPVRTAGRTGKVTATATGTGSATSSRRSSGATRGRAASRVPAKRMETDGASRRARAATGRATSARAPAGGTRAGSVGKSTAVATKAPAKEKVNSAVTSTPRTNAKSAPAAKSASSVKSAAAPKAAANTSKSATTAGKPTSRSKVSETTKAAAGAKATSGGAAGTPVSGNGAASGMPARVTTAGPYEGDEKFLAEQRQLLESERAVYEGQASDLRAEADSLAQEREPGDVQFDEESGEGGTVTVDRERDLALSAQALAAVDEIDAALARIADGTYGACERCHQAIPKPRLKALPFARLCVACKSGGLSRR